MDKSLLKIKKPYVIIIKIRNIFTGENFMKIAVTADTACDLSKENLLKYDIKTIPFHVLLGNEEILDGEKTVLEILEYVDNSGVLPRTSGVNEYEFAEFFTEVLKEYDEIVHISISSGVSSTCQNAIIAAKGFKNVYVVDSKALSSAEGMLAINARELANEGKNAKEIAKILNNRAEKLQCSFVVERLDFLHKGGRCSGFQLLGANLFKIRPRIVMRDGKMSNDKKYRGDMKLVIPKYTQDLLQEFINADKTRVIIAHVLCTDEMINGAVEVLKNAGFNEIIVQDAGATVTSHCGLHTIGVFYFNDAN